MGKGSADRPMDIPRDEFEKKRSAIWPPTPKHCPACGYLPSWCICTDDGPGQAGEVLIVAKPFTGQPAEIVARPHTGEPATFQLQSSEAKPPYERRRFERD